ncbi:MAG TPA: hypothetical protein VNO23_05625 [Candidatus Binatia bacterium]|nr:hypothetical protein [Candidatus Binatia bacterium]
MAPPGTERLAGEIPWLALSAGRAAVKTDEAATAARASLER